MAQNNNVETWVCALTRNDGGGSGFDVRDYILLSTSGREQSADDLLLQGMHIPCITNKPSVSASVNLETNKVSISNVSVTCVDVPEMSQYGWMTLASGDTERALSEYLLDDNSGVLNQTATLYKWNYESSTTSTAFFKGRCVDIKVDRNKIYLTLQSRRVWDDLEIANEVTDNGAYVPVTYGTYSPNTTSYASPQELYSTSYRLHEVPFSKKICGKIMCLANESHSSNAKLHIYDEQLNSFLPFPKIDGNFANSTLALDGKNYFFGFHDIKRGIITQSGTTDSTLTDYTSTRWTNPENVVDGNDSTFAQSNGEPSGTIFSGSNDGEANAITDTCGIGVETPVGKIDSLQIEIKCSGIFNLTGGAFGGYSGSDASTRLEIRGWNSNYSIPAMEYDRTGWSGGNITETISGTTTHTFDVNSTNFANMPKTEWDEDIITIPDDLRIVSRYWADDMGGTNTYYLHPNYKVYYLKFKIKYKNDLSATNQQQAEFIRNAKFYSGTNGFKCSWDASENTYNPVRIYRDVLHRYCGITTTPDGFSNLNNIDNIQSTWYARANFLEPKSVREFLDELQYEGCFFGFFPRNNTTKMRYVSVKETGVSAYSSSDVVQTLDESDLSDWKISTTSFKNLLTKMKVEFDIHPVSDKPIKSVTYEDSTARTKYNITAEEKIKKVRLKYLWGTGLSNVPRFYYYYKTIMGEIKVLVDCEIVNPNKMNLELGDIVKLDIKQKKCYGLAWSDIYFMVVGYNLTIGKMSLKLREVGRV